MPSPPKAKLSQTVTLKKGNDTMVCNEADAEAFKKQGWSIPGPAPAPKPKEPASGKVKEGT